MRALAWTGVVILGATACILNPQPLPPDNPEGGSANTSGTARDAGEKLGTDSGKAYPPPPADGGAPFEAGGGGGEGGAWEGGEAGEFEGGLEGGGDAAPEAGPGDGGKPVEGSAGDAGPG